MKMFFLKIKLYYKKFGILDSILRFLDYQLKNKKSKKLEKKIFANNNTKDIFTDIYNLNYWGDNESRSGTGSSLKSTENIRKELPKIVSRLNIKSITDIPCGDFNWFSNIIRNLNVEYFGGDIVLDLINKNKKFQNDNIKFKQIDLIKDQIPFGDLLICRDCLFHFSYKDIKRIFSNFQKSSFKHILITNHNLLSEELKNKDCKTGSFRFLDFHLEPFNFINNYDFEILDTDYPKTYIQKKVLIYSKENFLINLKNISI